MSDFVVGIPIGIAIGIAIGISIGIAFDKNQKQWSELTDEEKRSRKISMGVGIVTLIIGIIVFLWQLFK